RGRLPHERARGVERRARGGRRAPARTRAPRRRRGGRRGAARRRATGARRVARALPRADRAPRGRLARQPARRTVSGPTWELLRELADFRSDDAAALSVYVRLDPSESPTPPAVATRFNSLLTEVERVYLGNGEDGARKRAIRAGVERVREWS